jgi:hypothetical protein
MRITGPNGTGVAANAPQARRAASGTFNIGSADTSQPAKQAPAPRGVGGIDALIALQGVEDTTERRRRAVKRGRHALDALDDLKLGLLSGALDTAALARLMAAASDLKDGSGDAALDTVLAEISLRAEVELAKFGPPQGGPDRTR